MDDLIRRQDAIDLCDWYENPSMHDDLIKLPSAQQWIPCSESLPMAKTDVLLTSWNGKQQFVGWLDFFGRWHDDDDFEVTEGYEPLAWMPLPEPYKAESEVEE